MSIDTRNILVVDDEENVINALVRTIRVKYENIAGTSDTQEALNMIRQKKYAIIISDQRMPGMTGVELLLAAREISPDTIRILITGYTDIGVIISAINNGHIFSYISKPWNEFDLMNVLDNAMDAYEATIMKEQNLQKILHEKEEWYLMNTQLSQLIDRNMYSSVNTLKKIIEVKDPDLLEHSIRVSRIATQLSQHLGLSNKRTQNLEFASIFHDIGKIAIRDEILYKRGRLNETEYDAMKHHPVYGANILKELSYFEHIAQIVLQHHEKYDGTGYPRNLREDQICMEARILAVADVYDSLITTRIYRAGLPQEKVIAILDEESGRHFDPVVVRAVQELVDMGMLR